jgi:IS5 family transposase
VHVDKQHKLIRQYAVTDAAVHDSQVLEDVLLPAEAGREIWADSAYRSAEIETQLKAKRLHSKIHHKAARNKPLTAQQKTHNHARSRIRARVEHVFGHQVTAMGGKLIRTIGLLRATVKIGLKNLTYNMQRFLILTRPRKMPGA